MSRIARHFRIDIRDAVRIVWVMEFKSSAPSTLTLDLWLSTLWHAGGHGYFIEGHA